MMQNFVYISVEIHADFERNLLNKQVMPFLSQYYNKKNIAVFKEKTVQNDDNYWHQLFATRSSEEMSLPLFNKNIANTSETIDPEKYKLMNYEQKLFHKYNLFCHSQQTLKNNLYPTDIQDFPDFVSTISSTISFEKIPFENKILAVDCEMVIRLIFQEEIVSTEYGLELARISIVNFEGEVLVDELVKTPNHIVNYNTPYSGITADMLKNVTFDLKQAQNIVLQYVCKDSIIIGHSLENDLIALKKQNSNEIKQPQPYKYQMIHTRVIDTSVLYLAKTERKLKLRDLAQKFLNCKIQQGSHCPSEDAKSSLSLAKLRIEILDKFDNSKLISGGTQLNLDLLDQIIKSNNTILVIDQTESLMRLLQYGVHYDEIKQNTNEQRFEKILKWVKKKKRDNCIIPRIIMTKLIPEKKQLNCQDLDNKLREIVENSPKNSVFAINFELDQDSEEKESAINIQNPFCIFIGI